MKFGKYIMPALLGAALLGACADNPAAAPGDRPKSAHALGLVEITLTGVGTPRMSASVKPLGGGAVPGARMDLTPVPGGTPAGSIQMQRVSATTVDVGTRGAGGRRYIQAVFQVRNADASGTAYNTPRTNLTFLPVGIPGAIDGTPVRSFSRQDGSVADSAMAMHLMPTGAVTLDGVGGIVSQYPDVIQAYSESEANSFDMPAAVTNKLPYGFVVRNATDSSTRTLPADPAPGQFDGRVTFAYSIPLAATAADDPATISIVAVAMDDPETRITQSKEEQTPAGQSAFEARAAEISATSVTLLEGGAYTGGITTRTLCDIRVSGTSGNAGETMSACSAPDPTPAGLVVNCHASVTSETVSCDASPDVVLASTNVSAANGTLQFDLTIQNLLPEAMGTPDGVIVDTAGIGLAFGGFTVTSGTGAVTLANPDGMRGVYPAIIYPEKLLHDEVSSAHTWQLSYEPGVQTFDFQVRVKAELQPFLVINELLANPGGTITDAYGEWVEVYNAGRYPVDMQKVLFADSAASGRRPYNQFQTPLTIAGGGYMVMGDTTFSDKNGGVPVDYAYGPTTVMSFANSLDAFKLARVYATDTLTLDRVQYASAAISAQNGISRELKNPFLDNSNMDGSNWADALASSVYGPGGRGTPKAQNSTYVP